MTAPTPPDHPVAAPSSTGVPGSLVTDPEAAESAAAGEDQLLPTHGGIRPTGSTRDWRLFDVVGPVAVFGVFIGVWYLMHHWALRAIWDKPSFLVPPPHEVVDVAFLDGANRADLLDGLKWTSIVTFSGLGIAIVIGMTLAVAMAQTRWLERATWPYLIAVQAMPILALVPLIGSILGFGRTSRIFVCVIISLFPVVANTLFGLLSADRGQHDLFTLMGASRWTRLRKLQIPAALPAIFAGFRISAGLSVIGAIVGEIFFRRGSDNGLGRQISRANDQAQFPLGYGAIVLSSILGIAVFALFGWLSKLAIGRWHETTRRTG